MGFTNTFILLRSEQAWALEWVVLFKDHWCQGLISEHPCSDFRPARIVSNARLSTATSDSHRLHYITFYPYFCILSPLLSPSPYPLHVFSRPWCGERTLSVLPSHQASSSVISILSRLYISSPITPDRSYRDR